MFRSFTIRIALLLANAIGGNRGTSKRKTSKRLAESLHPHFHFRSHALHDHPLHPVHNLLHRLEEERTELFREVHHCPVLAMLQHLLRSLRMKMCLNSPPGFEHSRCGTSSETACLASACCGTTRDSAIAPLRSCTAPPRC